MTMPYQLITGQPAAEGIAIGEAVVVTARPDRVEGSDLSCAKHTVDNFNEAVRETHRQLRTFQDRIQKRITEPVEQLFTAHHMILEDTCFTGEMQKRIEAGVYVQDAINEVTNEYLGKFSQYTNSHLREKCDDIEDITRRLLRNLHNPIGAVDDIDYGGQILITPKLYPSDILRLVAQKVEGIILTSGGVTAHISVIARSLEVPMILATGAQMADIPTGTTLLMDAHTGAIHVNPDSMVLSSYEGLLAADNSGLSDAETITPQTHTRDGRRIRLLAAIGLISEARVARKMQAEGIGLYRSEIPFLIRGNLLSEDEQYTVYRKIMEEMEEREVIFRTLDIGGDKIFNYFPEQHKENRFLGLRGLRFTFRYKEVFTAQIRALLRAAHDRPLKIMFPLVSSVDSFTHARDIVRAIVSDLEKENVPHHSNPELGAMIELPCAVSLADELATEADFFSIGSSDLVQYMLAVDRTNKEVADWYVSFHPAVLRAIKTVVEAAHRHNRQVAICGEMASDPKLIPVLIGMGVTMLTIPPRRIAQIQRLVQSIDAAEAEELSKKVLGAATVAEISRMIDNARVFPGNKEQEE